MLLVCHDQTCKLATRIIRRFVIIALVELDSDRSFLFCGIVGSVLVASGLLVLLHNCRGVCTDCAVVRQDDLGDRTSVIVWIFAKIAVITV